MRPYSTVPTAAALTVTLFLCSTRCPAQSIEHDASITTAWAEAFRMNPPSSTDAFTSARVSLGMVQGAPPSKATPTSETTPSATEPEEINNGQDITRPVRRFDVRYQYQDLPSDTEQHLLTLRTDQPFKLSDEWTLNTRFDLPLVSNNVPSADNPTGDDEFGVGDVLAQALFVHPLTERFAMAGGAQLIFPTATEDQFGTGRYRIVPTVAGVYRAEWLPKGWWLGGLVRYDVDFAGDDDRDFREAFMIQPLFNMALPDRWFATFAPEFKVAAEDDHDWFIPFDVTVGKMVTPTTIVSVEYKHALIDDFPQYDWAVEFRIGFFY